MFTTYILENPNGLLYIGQTNNLLMGAWRIIFSQEFQTKEEAYAYERYLKSLKSSKYIREKILK